MLDQINFKKYLCLIGWLSQFLRNAFFVYFFLRHPVDILNPGSHSECTLFFNMQHCTYGVWLD